VLLFNNFIICFSYNLQWNWKEY